MAYEDYVRETVMAPLGLRNFRIGEAGVPDRALVRHHEWRAGALVGLERDASSDAVLKRLGGAGGWVGTVREYFVFASQPLDREASVPPPFIEAGDDYYGLGWRIWPGAGGHVLTHFGFMPGVFSLVIRKPDGGLIVALFNGGVRSGDRAFRELSRALRQASDW